MLKPLLVLAIAFASLGAAPAPEEMVFFSYSNGGNCEDCSVMVARGEITDATPDRFRAFLQDNPSGWLLLDSKGGNLHAALELGRIIRENGLNTTIGDVDCDRLPKDGVTVFDAVPCGKAKAGAAGSAWENGIKETGGVCLSACAYAFLGGVARLLDPEARFDPQWEVSGNPDTPAAENKVLGFHQHHAGDDMQAVALGGSTGAQALARESEGASQYATGELADYVAAMGVNLRILLVAADAAPDSFVYPDIADLKAMRVVQSRSFSRFKLVPMGSGVAAVSLFVSDAINSRQIALLCSPKREIFAAYARPSADGDNPAAQSKLDAGLEGDAFFSYSDGFWALEAKAKPDPDSDIHGTFVPADEGDQGDSSDLDPYHPANAVPPGNADTLIFDDGKFEHFLFRLTPAELGQILAYKSAWMFSFGGSHAEGLWLQWPFLLTPQDKAAILSATAACGGNASAGPAK